MSRRNARRILLPIAGFMLWASAFLTLYAALSLGCRLGWEEIELAGITVQRVVLITVFAAHLAALAGLTWWTHARWRAAGREGPASFLAAIAFYGSIAALAATVFNFAAVFWLTSCDTHQAALHFEAPAASSACPAYTPLV